MKRIAILLLAAILCLCCAGCGTKPESAQGSQEGWSEATDTESSEEMQPSDSSISLNEEAEKAEEPAQPGIELTGPWHLDSGKNDLDEFAGSLELFPGYGEWGASMEIQSDGQMSWYIGAENWHGTYTLADGVIHARLTSDSEQTPQLWDFRIAMANESVMLEMDYQDMTIYWAYGSQEDPAYGTDHE